MQKLHPIGIGTWDIGSKRNPETGSVDPIKGSEDKEIEAIRYCLSKGQNHIDTAELYGSGYTDEIVGRAIAGRKREDDAPWEEAPPQINRLIDEGLVLNFGVSNFKISDMKKAMKVSEHPIVANQLHFNILYKQDATKAVREFCNSHDIQIVAYKPIARGNVYSDDKVVELARRLGGTAAQVSLAWLIQQGALPIPKATSKSHIDENLGAMDIGEISSL